MRFTIYCAKVSIDTASRVTTIYTLQVLCMHTARVRDRVKD